MSAFQKYRYECLAGMLTVVLFIAAFYFTATNADAQAVRSALLVFVIADGIGLYFTLCKLWRTKWKKAFITSVQKAIAKLIKRIAPFLEKFSKDKKTTVLKGKTTISFDFSLFEQDKSKSKKITKWKNLRNDRERLGHLYKSMIEFNIKHGLLVYSSDTPSEIEGKKENENFETQIFDLYIKNRYKAVVETDSEMLNILRKELYKQK